MRSVLVCFFAVVVLVSADNHLFRNADVDIDGHLTEQEFDRIFDHWDTNGDRKVDQYEFTTGWDRDDWDDDVDSRLEFHLFDINDDGFVTDVPDLRHIFKTFDINGDGQISGQEFKKTWDSLFDD